MSTIRHAAMPKLLLRTLALDLPAGMQLEEHAHPWPQLVFAARGALAVAVADRSWVVPAHRALWVPAGMPHRVETLGEVSLRTLYFAAGPYAGPGASMCVLAVPGLLRELILAAVRAGPLVADVAVHAHLAGLIAHEVSTATLLDLALPLPRDVRARRVADRMRADLREARTLAELAQGTGASPRTIERLFLAETQLSFGQWRQQARMLHALRRLAEAVEVATVAGECGYESVSAFVSRFRQAFGVTPGQFMRKDRAIDRD
jgi:AraC-like DNA-binding protein/mannose-6-phosphate isomerase-like protein (cupin superfamily)